MSMFFEGNLIGVMQGRLLPKYLGRYQAHPVGYWQEEFSKAQNIGLNCIEFILDQNDIEQNPLMHQDGLNSIAEQVQQTGVKVVSVCADSFMQSPLHAGQDADKANSISVLKQLLTAARQLSIKDIVIPCVDNSSLQAPKAYDSFVEVLLELKTLAEAADINLSLETDLAPAPFAKLLSDCDSTNVTVNYDIGNSAALGYDFHDELAAYGEKITDLHVKDRELGGGPVELGTGNADIPGFFQALQKFHYQGPIIMQAYRDDEGEAIFRQQLHWLQQILGG